MIWNYFNKIYLINLPSRPDRLQKATQELGAYSIPFEVFPATQHNNGAYGIFLTLKALFTKILSETNPPSPLGRGIGGGVLIFEDDARFLQNPNDILPHCLAQLPADYDMFFLGCNHKTPMEYYSENLFRVNNAKALHAVSYSLKAMEQLMPCFNKFTEPIDRVFIKAIQQKGNCYCANPIIASQYADYSDIEKKYVNYEKAIEKRFEQNIPR